MINVLISNARLVAARQKKAGKGGATKQLLAITLPQGPVDFAATAQLLREKLRKQNVRDKSVNLILGEQIIFKEFSHQPVSAKAVAGFARIEAKTVLRENAQAYSIGCMHYGRHKSDAGEETSMLLAAPTHLLKAAAAGFGAAGFSVDSVHSVFDCYTAVMAKVLPIVAPKLTGAAIDFGYEYTLINLYCEGELVSQRRLSGILDCLAEPVMEDTGCTVSEVSEKLAQNQFSPAYAAKAQAAITNFTYDILRTLRVLTAPLHITPESFVLTGAACRDTVFLRFVIESLGVPCVVADEVAPQITRFFAPKGSISGLFVLSGPLYTAVDLLADLREKKKNTVINTSTCIVLTGVVALALAIQPLSLMVERSMMESEQKRYESLMDVEARLDELGAAKSMLSSLDAKEEALALYTSNTSDTLPRALQLFADEALTLQQVAYDGAGGAYQATFLAATKEDFLRLKDTIYASGEYYLNLSMSIVRQTDEGDYLCLLYFVPADYAALPQAESTDDTAQVDTTTDELLEGIA